jgi:GNAT superfamily N-acetyltransferase
MPIEVRPAQTRRERRIFMEFPWRIYRNDPLWSPPALPQIAERLDPSRNPVIAAGIMVPYIAWRGNEPVGTIVVADDTQRNADWGDDDIMFGFFECIEDYAAAEALFDAAVAWARASGRSRLHGPWNLDYEDRHGALVKGWDRPPVIMCGHNPPYYPAFIERYGFRKGRRDSLAFAYDLTVPEPIPPKLARVAEKIRARGRVGTRRGRVEEWERELEIAVDVLQRGLSVLEQGPDRAGWPIDRFRVHAEALRPVLDPDFVIFGLADGKEVGLVMGLPDLNPAFKAANGLRHPWDYPKLLLAMRRQPDCVTMKSIALDPAYWNRGIDALMVYDFACAAAAKGYKWVDLSLTGEDNPMTPRLATNLGAAEYKRYRIYELML